jgi:hypothetical protein
MRSAENTPNADQEKPTITEVQTFQLIAAGNGT